MRTRRDELLHQVQRLRSLKLSVIPIHAPGMPLLPGMEQKNIGKIALIRWTRYQRRLPSRRKIDEWSEQWPGANLAVVTGRISGVIVLDSDGQEGAETLKRFGSPPRTWRHSTGRGEHFWFKHPGGIVSNFTKKLPGLDLRGEGGYVVVPPSRHRNRRQYAWVVDPDEAPLADPPTWLLDLIGIPRSTTSLPATPVSGWVAGALQGVEEGLRDDTCTRLAGYFLGHGIDVETTMQILGPFAARCKPPFPLPDVEKCVESIARREASRHPHPQAVDAVDAIELLDKDFPENPGPVRGLIEPESLTVLGGPPKLFKSALVQNLALRVATGTPWLGFPTTRGRGLILQAEIAARHLQTRLRLMTQSLAPPLKPDSLLFVSDRSIRLDAPQGQDRIRQLIGQHHPDLFVIDPLARFMTGDENRTQDMNAVVGFLDELIQVHHLAVVLVHHTAKGSATERLGGQRLRGSSVLFAAADSVLMLDRPRGNYILSFQLRHAPEPPPLSLRVTSELWLETGISERLRAIMNLATGIRYSDLRDAVKTQLQVSQATATRLIAEAKQLGLIVQHSHRYLGSQDPNGS